jgi:hypothetical protein
MGLIIYSMNDYTLTAHAEGDMVLFSQILKMRPPFVNFGLQRCYFFKKNLHGNPVWSAGLILKQSPSWTLRGFLARACFISRAPQQTPIAEAETTAVTSRLDHKQTPKARKNPADYSTSTSVVVHESVAKLRKVISCAQP